MASRHKRTWRALLAAVLLALLALTPAVVARAANGSGEVRDAARFFTPNGVSQIEKAAQDAGLRVLVITNNQQFSSRNAWRSWLKG